MGPFETFARNLRAAWAASPPGQAMLGAIGYLLGDATDDQMVASLLEEIPSTAQDPASLQLALSERQIEPGPALSLADLQQLANAAPNLNRHRGRPLGTLLGFYYAGLGTPYLAQQNGLVYRITAAPNLDDLAGLVALPSWCTRWQRDAGNPAIPASTDGKPAIAVFTVPWWTLDVNPMDSAGNQFNSRFGLYYSHTPTPPDFTDATVLARAKRTVKAWKPARASCVGAWVAASNVWWNKPGVKWNDGTKWGGASGAHYTLE